MTRRRDDRGAGIWSAVSALRARLEQRPTGRRTAVAAAGRPAAARLGQWPVPVPGCDPRVFDLFRDAAARGGRAA